jgi:indole-3-glycerol phosphate synthase
MIAATNFLDEIVARKRETIARVKAAMNVYDLIDRARCVRKTSQPFALRSAITSSTQQFAVIAEFKRASPSKGNINSEADPASVALEFEKNGAAAVSVLTEENYFQGSLDDLQAAITAVSIPVLRKDFIIDEFQVFETAAAGADALLLIATALTNEKLASLRRLAEEELQMNALVEVHNGEEMDCAVDCGATLIGVNNRDLRTFEVSLSASHQCASLAPANVILISESGLREKAELERLRALGFQGFLIGETLMSADDPGEVLRCLLEQE